MLPSTFTSQIVITLFLRSHSLVATYVAIGKSRKFLLRNQYLDDELRDCELITKFCISSGIPKRIVNYTCRTQVHKQYTHLFRQSVVFDVHQSI